MRNQDMHVLNSDENHQKAQVKDIEGDISKEPEFGNPPYRQKDDIYNNEKNEGDLFTDEKPDMEQQRDQSGYFGDDLDIPGAELDDQDEEIGEEDEENNYYSLGGDDHNDLEEDKED